MMNNAFLFCLCFKLGTNYNEFYASDVEDEVEESKADQKKEEPKSVGSIFSGSGSKTSSPAPAASIFGGSTPSSQSLFGGGHIFSFSLRFINIYNLLLIVTYL